MACLALFAGLISGAARAEQTRPTRIVLITLDTLRYDVLLGEHGAQAMPATHAFVSRGLLFRQYYSAASSTQPAHATLFTALHPWQHGVVRNGLVLSEDHLTLAERLQSGGYRTEAVVAAFPLHRKFGFAQGFDHYDDSFTNRHRGVDGEWSGETVEDDRFLSLCRTITRRAIVRLDAAAGSRQFFWFHYFDPHEPYGDAYRLKEPRSGVVPLRGLLKAARGGDRNTLVRSLQYARQLYARDLGVLDTSLGQLLERIDRDRETDTHVILVSDHGESFGEGGALGHGERLTREQIHVPLALVSPRVAAGDRDEVVGSLDLVATVLALAGIDAQGVPGRDLTAAPGAGTGSAVGMRRTPPFDEIRIDGRKLAVREQGFYAVRDGQLVTGNSAQVFREDLPNQPLTSESATSWQELFAEFEAALKNARAGEHTDPQTRRALEALGYAP